MVSINRNQSPESKTISFGRVSEIFGKVSKALNGIFCKIGEIFKSTPKSKPKFTELPREVNPRLQRVQQNLARRAEVAKQTKPLR